MLQTLRRWISSFWSNVLGKPKVRSVRSLIAGGMQVRKADVVPIKEAKKLLVGISYRSADRLLSVPLLSCLVPDGQNSIQVIDVRSNQSIDGGVYYPQGGCVDEFAREVSVDLDMLTQEVLFTLRNSPYGPGSKVRSVTIHLADYQKRELLRFTMPWSDNPAVRVIGRIYKHLGRWHFQAVGGIGEQIAGTTPEDIVNAVRGFVP